MNNTTTTTTKNRKNNNNCQRRKFERTTKATFVPIMTILLLLMNMNYSNRNILLLRPTTAWMSNTLASCSRLQTIQHIPKHLNYESSLLSTTTTKTTTTRTKIDSPSLLYLFPIRKDDRMMTTRMSASSAQYSFSSVLSSGVGIRWYRNQASSKKSSNHRNKIIPRTSLSSSSKRSSAVRYDDYDSDSDDDDIIDSRKKQPVNPKKFSSESKDSKYKKVTTADNDYYNNYTNNTTNIVFEPGMKVQVEIISFGPLGATVDVVALGTHDPESIIPLDTPPFASGLILQREIQYFRQSRNNVDVIRGEILPAYVEKVRHYNDMDDETTNKDNDSTMIPKLDISLRAYGGKAKADEIGQFVFNKLNESEDGTIPLGDKSTPLEISTIFPGVSKVTFKKAISALYKQRLIQQPMGDMIQLSSSDSSANTAQRSTNANVKKCTRTPPAPKKTSEKI